MFVGNDGAIHVMWVVGEGGWSPPQALTAAGVAPPGGVIALASQGAPNQLDALFVGNDGAIHVMWVVGDGGWSPPQALTAAGVAPPGGAIALAEQGGANQLDALFVGNDGAIHVMWVVGDGNWSQPEPLTPVGTA